MGSKKKQHPCYTVPTAQWFVDNCAWLMHGRLREINCGENCLGLFALNKITSVEKG